MVSQIRAVLQAYLRNGGSYREEVIEDCGHSPHVEKPEKFQRALFGFLEGQGSIRLLREQRGLRVVAGNEAHLSYLLIEDHGVMGDGTRRPSSA
jgi:hypothetical protein